jgi:hypothetical protein
VGLRRGHGVPQASRRDNPARTVPVARQPPARGRYVYCIIGSNKPLKPSAAVIVKCSSWRRTAIY